MLFLFNAQLHAQLYVTLLAFVKEKHDFLKQVLFVQKVVVSGSLYGDSWLALIYFPTTLMYLFYCSADDWNADQYLWYQNVIKIIGMPVVKKVHAVIVDDKGINSDFKRSWLTKPSSLIQRGGTCTGASVSIPCHFNFGSAHVQFTPFELKSDKIFQRLQHMRTKQPGLIQSNLYTFSLVWFKNYTLQVIKSLGFSVTRKITYAFKICLVMVSQLSWTF